MTQTAPNRPTLMNWFEIIVLGMIWGASFLSVHLALDGFGPFWVAAGRITIAAMALVAVIAWQRIRLPSLRGGQRVWLHAAGMALFSNALPFTLLAWAQQHVTTGFTGITMAMVPLFTLILAHSMVVGERLTGPRLMGFALGLTGVIVLIGTDALTAVGTAIEPTARALCVLSALSYACGSIITRRCPPVDPVAFSTLALLIASALIVPVALMAEGVPALPALRPALALAYLGLLPTALATLILVHVIRTAGPTFLTQTNYHVPVWSVILGTVILAEPLPPQFLAALGLILAGLAISRITRRKMHADPAT